MKNLRFCSIIAALLSIVATAFAQRPNEVSKSFQRQKHRQEFVIPQIQGYNVYTADLHTHTIYSDGAVTPSFRVREAWRDGLDIIAITDHTEYRRIERGMINYMDKYIKDEYRNVYKGINTNLQGKDADERGILVDLNHAYNEAYETNQQYGLLVIRGMEITRNAGHYNAIFTEDNNKIYNPDIEKMVENAYKQGAYIFQNHPKNDKNTVSSMTPLAERLHGSGMVKGIEICNGPVMWARLISYCLDNGYAPISNSDVHDIAAYRFYPEYNDGCYRNMTLILAKKCDEKSIKEALFAGRTIAYHNNKLIGKEEYLAELFKNSVTIEHMCDHKKAAMVILTNKSSFPYEVRWGEKNRKSAVIGAMSAVQIELPKGASAETFTVNNLICGNGKRPKVTMTFKRKNSPFLEQDATWHPY